MRRKVFKSYRFWGKEHYSNACVDAQNQNFGPSEDILTPAEVGFGPAATHCNYTSNLLMKEIKDKETKAFIQRFFFFFF